MSASIDRFVHDRLPPRAQWPELRYDLPGVASFPTSVNLVDELLDKAQANGHGDRPLLRSPERTLELPRGASSRSTASRRC